MATEIRMPQFGVSMETGTISEWKVSVGDEVHKGDVLAVIETEKLTNDVISEVDGVVLAIVAEEYSDIPVQGLMAVVGSRGEKWDGQAETAGSQERIKATPLARKIAKDLDVDLSKVTPNGTSGRIRAQDVYDQAKRAGAQTETEEPAALAGPAKTGKVTAAALTPFVSKNLQLMEGDETEVFSGMRKVIAERMFTSCSEIPQVTQTVQADVTKLMEFRKMLNEGRENRLSVNDFVLKAVAKSLRKHPEIRVSIDGETLIRRAHVNLGMAVAVENGLIVPVIKDADKMGIEELSAAARDYAARARNNTLTTDEYKGSTFTVSNMGMYGVVNFNPVINQPDAAILGVCAITDQLTLNEEGAVEVRKKMNLCLTFDHRLIDGAAAATFQNTVRKYLESPMEILL